MPSRRLTTTHAKVLSFAYSGSSVAWNRFCSLWLLKCGYAPRQVGAMKSLSLLAKLVAQPLWAGTADVGSPPMVLAASVVLSSATLELLRLGTRWDFEEHSPGGATWPWSLLGLGASSKERAHHAILKQPLAPVVWRVAALRVARSASSAASPVADAMVLALARDGGEAWGRQRFWGSASWGLGSVGVGLIIDRHGLEWGLFGMSHLLSGALLLFLVFWVEPNWDIADGGEPPPPPFHVSLRNMQMRRPKKKPKHVLAAVSRGLAAVKTSDALRLALLNAILFGTTVVSVDSILYMQLEAELHVSRTLSGLATAVSTVATFPVFWTSAHLVSRYGHWTVLVLAQAILPVRLLLHAMVTKANVGSILLPIQLLHGPMFAAWISAAVELVDRLAPPDLRASTQSLLTMSYFTIGGAVGHLVWSATLDLYGATRTYLAAAVFSAIHLVLFGIAARPHVNPTPPKDHHPLHNDNHHILL
ncbi:hypothetical protein CTAYLR_008208 [Chrysophaeum taylorii]|uniref:Major facilitator superfamily (MFS) profile domain-containing protein n=1 Tax=Chrysophaeum taylorii TaxID=2483200 RepID=A0AAD7U9U6_9STRA|nr:hypothetical protein CTAYLR_008208 [Chrysophaeum taylorii]